MAKQQVPERYKTPLRSRKGIEHWLNYPPPYWNARYSDDHRAQFRFCCNVKLHGLDFSWDNLVLRHTRADNGTRFADLEWTRMARELFDREWSHGTNSQNLYEVAVEDARRPYISNDQRDGGAPEEYMSVLFSGQKVDVRFTQFGRSGGWLALWKFEGYELTDRLDLQDIDFRTLRNLYAFLTMVGVDLKDHTPTRRVEEAAAWFFFENVCADLTSVIPPPSVFVREPIIITPGHEIFVDPEQLT